MGGPTFNWEAYLNEIKNRNYTMYEDSSTDAIDTNFAVIGSAHILTKKEIDELSNNSNLRKIGIRYLYYYDSYYRNSSWPISRRLYTINYLGKKTSSYSNAVGLRPVVKLKATVQATANEGQTTHDTLETAWNLSLHE